MKIFKPIIPTEAEEQIRCIHYLDYLRDQGNEILYTATAQATFTTSFNQIRKNKATGVRKGLPDLIIIINKQLLMVELKRVKGGITSSDQKVWISRLKEANQIAEVCKGFDEFKSLIDLYIN